MHRLNEYENASVLLTLVDGTVSQGIVSVLESYGYVQDSNDAMQFWLSDPADEVGLRFNREWTAVWIIGDSLENIENTNYVLNRGGWDSARAIVGTPDAEEQLLSCFASTTITDLERAWEEGQPQPIPPSSAPTPMASAVHPEKEHSPPPPPLFDSPSRTIPSTAASQSQQNGKHPPQNHDEEVVRLQMEVQSLRSQLQERINSAAPSSSQSANQSLLALLERFVLAHIETSCRDDHIVHLLKDAGYTLSIKIVPKQS